MHDEALWCLLAKVDDLGALKSFEGVLCQDGEGSDNASGGQYSTKFKVLQERL